jgi:1-acyl-sn-glycerol-3-phosphate acyltransferase
MNGPHRKIVYEPPRALRKKPSYIPTARVIGDIGSMSVRVLARHARGSLSPQYLNGLLEWWWPRVFQAGNGKLDCIGLDRVDWSQSHLIMSNHQSLLDVPAIVGCVGGGIRMVAKQELVDVPVWGNAMKAAGMIPVDRNNRDRAIEQLEKAKEVLASGMHVWIAAEGTRSRTGDLGTFKKGGFHVALSLGAPIVPTWVEGTQEIIRPDSFRVHFDGHVTVGFAEAIPTQGREEDLPGLMADVRKAMEAVRAEVKSSRTRG